MIRILKAQIGVVLSLATVMAAAQDPPKTWTVSPGQSIQEAVDNAAAGDTVQVLPGEYVQSVEITKDGITLRGLEYEGERATLNAKANKEDEPIDLAIRIHAKDSVVEGFVVRGYQRGVSIDQSERATLREMALEDLNNYGVSVTKAREVTMEQIVAGVVHGGAIAIMGSSSVTVSDSEMFASGAGLLISQSQSISVVNASIHHNWIGVVATGAAPDSTSYLTLVSCRIMGNNAAQTPQIEDPYLDAMSGVGVLISGASHTEISRCTIAENGSMGILTMAFGRTEARHAENNAVDSGPPSEHTYVHHNRYYSNGGAPCKAFKERFAGVAPGDLYWDGLGERNQWQEEADLKTYPEKLVVKHGGVHTDVIHFQ